MALTQGNYLPDWLLEEFGAPNHCRSTAIVLTAGLNLKSGSVLATSGGKYVLYDDDAGGTVDVATAILINDCDASLGDKACLALVRGPAVISKGGLTWEASNDATEKANGLADLLALGITAVEGV